MTIATGQNANASDFVSSSSGAGDSGKVPKLGSDGKLARGFLPIVVETTTGTTHSLTTVAGQRVIVWAKGNNNGATGIAETYTLKYNGVTKDTVVTKNNQDLGAAFSLMYTEIPGAATQNITVQASAGTMANVVIIVMKI